MQAVGTDEPWNTVSPPFGKRVLFVDDEPHLLAALRRMLRSERERWDMVFASSGAEALALIERQPVDAIVSDMRMAGMDGAELLGRVQRGWPATARIILSGQADQASVIAVLRSAQQFLAKPCEAAVLIDAVDRALRVQRLLADPALREMIGGVASLPTMPTVYHDLVATLDAPEVDLQKLATILASDVSTSTELLKLVNSAFFGLAREISSVESAVSLLGLDNIQALVLAGSVFRVSKSLDGIVDVEALRASALRRAAIARAIAGREGWSPQDRGFAVLSCMLRDVGGLVLAEGRPEAAHRLTEITLAEGPIDPLRQAELEVEAYGCTVVQASAYLLGLWGFTPAVIHTVGGYPLVDPGPAATRFEYALRFAGLRDLDPFSPVCLESDDYLSAERLQLWNEAADESVTQ
ncbi:MAG TPA: HDOD domain-containing protein [Kineosporiaceae bacterium]|nr:HDOD domain-containing protein [Kineosporiaceae bacterium]